MHAANFAETGALICKVYKQAIGRNTWLSFAWSIPGKWTLFERETNVFMQLFLQKLELEFASFISKKLGETLDILLHESYLENADYWKGKWTFACRFCCRKWSLSCKNNKQAIGRNTWLPVAWSIPGKWTLLERETNVLMQLFLQKFELEFASFISKKLWETLDILLHESYLENADYWKGKWTFACRLCCRNWSLNCKVYKQAIWRNTWLSFA